jgi:hypothetical protein
MFGELSCHAVLEMFSRLCNLAAAQPYWNRQARDVRHCDLVSALPQRNTALFVPSNPSRLPYGIFRQFVCYDSWTPSFSRSRSPINSSDSYVARLLVGVLLDEYMHSFRLSQSSEGLDSRRLEDETVIEPEREEIRVDWDTLSQC